MTRVLVVDDAPDQTYLISNLLQRHGIEVETVVNGAQALEAIARQAPDLVVTDLQMPIMNGLELVHAASVTHPCLPIVLNLIRSATLQKMKKGVRLINCARGDVVNLDDLAEALSKGHVAGAALDVFPQEPPDFSAPIFKHPNVILTPHLGASTGEAQEKVAEMSAKQMVSYLLEGVIINAVNFPSIPMETMARLRLHLDLAEQMGSMVGQMIRQPCDMNITYSGYVTEYDTRVLTHAALKGLLSCFTDRPVNFVNAPYMAKAKGIKVQGPEAFDILLDAKEDRAPVEGRVASVNKGGFEVDLSGFRAFCPISQIDIKYCEKPEEHVGARYQFRIMGIQEKGKNIVVSRRES